MRYLKIVLILLIIVVWSTVILPVHAECESFLDLEEFFELVKTGTTEQIKAAISAGADVNARDEEGWTPLMLAASDNENPEVIMTLLDNGADGKMESMEGKTAFDYAKENEHIKGTKAYWRLNDARF